jgi:hypothetical protein
MKADLIGASDDHALIPVRGEGAVNDIITGVRFGSPVTGGASPAVMDKAPPIIVEVVSPDKYEGLKWASASLGMTISTTDAAVFLRAAV